MKSDTSADSVAATSNLVVQRLMAIYNCKRHAWPQEAKLAADEISRLTARVAELEKELAAERRSRRAYNRDGLTESGDLGD